MGHKNSTWKNSEETWLQRLIMILGIIRCVYLLHGIILSICEIYTMVVSQNCGAHFPQPVNNNYK